jgi:hypothetical protein
LIDYINKLYEIDMEFRNKNNEVKSYYQEAVAQLELYQQNLYDSYVRALNEYVNFTDNVYPKKLLELTNNYTTNEIRG